MTQSDSRLAHRAAEFRLAFDRSFAEPPAEAAPPTLDLLALRAGGEPYAVALSEIGGLFSRKKIIWVPGGPIAQLGLAGFRGAVVPVYDLSLLLGNATAGTPHWLVTASHEPLALAFEAFDGHLRVARRSIIVEEGGAQSDGGQSGRHVKEFVRVDDLIRPIVRLTSVIEAIRIGMPPSRPR